MPSPAPLEIVAAALGEPKKIFDGPKRLRHVRTVIRVHLFH